MVVAALRFSRGGWVLRLELVQFRCSSKRLRAPQGSATSPCLQTGLLRYLSWLPTALYSATRKPLCKLTPCGCSLYRWNGNAFEVAAVGNVVFAWCDACWASLWAMLFRFTDFAVLQVQTAADALFRHAGASIAGELVGTLL